MWEPPITRSKTGCTASPTISAVSIPTGSFLTTTVGSYVTILSRVKASPRYHLLGRSLLETSPSWLSAQRPPWTYAKGSGQVTWRNHASQTSPIDLSTLYVGEPTSPMGEVPVRSAFMTPTAYAPWAPLPDGTTACLSASSLFMHLSPRQPIRAS